MIGLGLVMLILTVLAGGPNTLNYVNVTVLVLTLAVLTHYAYDTHRLAEATEKHLDYQSTPVVTVTVDHRLIDIDPAGSDPTTVIHILNDSRFQLELKVRIVLQYGEHKAIHTDRYYSGKTIWNIGPGNYTGNFKIFPFFEDIGDKSQTMMDKLKNSQSNLKLFIFSEYRAFERPDQTFVPNMTKSYWLKQEPIPNVLISYGTRVPIPFVWVYEYEAPPDEIKQLALKDYPIRSVS